MGLFFDIHNERVVSTIPEGDFIEFEVVGKKIHPYPWICTKFHDLFSHRLVTCYRMAPYEDG
jgi:hypothetical protein